MSGGTVAPVIPPSSRVAALGHGAHRSVPAFRWWHRRIARRCRAKRPTASGGSTPRAACPTRRASCALGWLSGDRLTLTASAGVVVARRDAGGIAVLPSRGYLVIPAALRRRCGLRAGNAINSAAVISHADKTCSDWPFPPTAQ